MIDADSTKERFDTESIAPDQFADAYQTPSGALLLQDTASGAWIQSDIVAEVRR